jgi:Immunoglobulin I-set domain
MSHVSVIRKRLLLLVGTALISLSAISGVAHAEGFGEITRFGPPSTTQAPGALTPSELNFTTFKFRPWHVIGVDPKENHVFVLEETKPATEKKEETTRFLRLQEMTSTGTPLGEAKPLKVTLPSTGVGNEEAEQIQGIAVDSTAERVYFLVTEERGEEIPAENEGAAAGLYAFKATPNSKKVLEPALGANAEGLLTSPEKLHAESTKAGEALLQPHGITVDPHTHEVIIAAHVDEEPCVVEEGELECPERDELGNPLDHYVTQRVKENGELGELKIDTGNVLKQQKGEHFFAPGSPVVVGEGTSQRILADQLVEPLTGNSERTVAEFPAAGAPKQLTLPFTGGLENGLHEVTEPPAGDLGGSLVLSPDGSALYGVTKIMNEEEAAHHERLYAISERSATTLQPIGWTGGQRADSTDACVLEPGIFEGEHIQIAAGKEGDVFVLVPEYLREPGVGSFPTKDAIIEFGPGGKGCPAASAEKNTVNGKETSAPVGTGVPVTLSTFVKQGDALSVTWKIEDEATKALVTEHQTEDQYQTPTLVHTFTTAGTYKITEEIKTDNLATPAVVVTRAPLVVEEKTEPPKVITQPVSATVAVGAVAKFTAAASGKPTPSPQWWVSSDGGVTFEEDKEDKGAKTGTLEVTASEVKNGHKYRAVFTNSTKESVTTETVTLTVTPGESKEERERREARERQAAKEAQEARERQAAKEAQEARERQAAKEAQEAGERQAAKEAQEKAENKGGGAVLNNKSASPRATISSASLLVSASGAVSVKVSCQAGATTCTGSVTLRSASAVSASGNGKKTILALTSGSFSVSGGTSKTITLHLSAAARKLLARTHQIRARATVSAHDSSGQTATTATLVNLRPAPTKHKH